jgi:CcmD family protein
MRIRPAYARLSRAVFVVAVVAAWAASVVMTSPAIALAQEFQKVEGKVADNIPAVPFVGIAYGVIWGAVLVYVLVIGRGLGRVNEELRELRRKLDGAGAPRK